MLVVLNMSATAQTIKLDLAQKGIQSKEGKTLLSSFSSAEKQRVKEMTIPPFGAWIAQLQ